MRVLDIDHAAIETARLAETRAFFVEVLGLRVGPRPAFDFDGAWLYAGDKDVVHLVETEHDKLPSPAASINHFALCVANFEEALAKLQALGVPFETDTTPGGELSQIYVTDPNGPSVVSNSVRSSHSATQPSTSLRCAVSSLDVSISQTDALRGILVRSKRGSSNGGKSPRPEQLRNLQFPTSACAEHIL